MKFLGIDFVPFDEPLHKRLETFWAGFWFLIFVFGSILFTLPFVYLLWTPYRWITLAVAGLIYLDRDICEKGGRRNSWVRSWSCWRHMANYFDSQIIYDDGFELNPKENYIFGAFPHGIIPMGPYTGMQLESSPFQKSYSHFDLKLAVIKMNFLFPILRDLMLSMGFISCSSKSLEYVLTKPDKGTIVLLMVGGAKEALKTRFDQYKFVIKTRKGFVKLALRHGVPLVPVITFGETSLFEQIDFSGMRKFQQTFKKYFGFVPIVVNGRGLFQRSFGLFPKKTQLITVLGKPIEIQKADSPTNQQIDDVHAKFVAQLEELFEKYKHKCLKNPENVQLELL